MADADWQSRIETGRNEPCPCGSGKKYKKCHMAGDEQAESRNISERAAEAAAAAAAEPPPEVEPDRDQDRHGYDARKHDKGGPARPGADANPSRRINAPRKTGAS